MTVYTTLQQMQTLPLRLRFLNPVQDCWFDWELEAAYPSMTRTVGHRSKAILQSLVLFLESSNQYFLIVCVALENHRVSIYYPQWMGSERLQIVEELGLSRRVLL